MLKLAPALLAILISSCNGAPAADLVTSLPGWDGPLPSKHYSGLIPVDGGKKQLHYYLQEADEGAADAPLVLWMNGS